MSNDDITEMIENNAGKAEPVSQEQMMEALRNFSAITDEETENDPRIIRYHTLGAYPLDVKRDGSDEYFRALTEAILAITDGDCGSIDYKGYRLYYTDTPHVKSYSLTDGSLEYSYEISFQCDAIRMFSCAEYHSEEERKAFLDPANELFEKTLALLDKQIERLDNGEWLKERKTLNIHDFRDYSGKERRFKKIEWEERDEDASHTISFLIDDALSRAKGSVFTQDDFEIFAGVIRRMVYFADYGKLNYLFELQGLILFQWKPKTKQDRYIWRCMNEFGQGDLPDRLLDNCTLYYFLENPKGWEAVANLLPIMALSRMCCQYEPDQVKNEMLQVFNLIPGKGYRERIEKLIEEDRAKAGKGESEDDQENI